MLSKSGNLPGLLRAKRRFGAVANSAHFFSRQLPDEAKDLITAHREFVYAFRRAWQSRGSDALSRLPLDVRC